MERDSGFGGFQFSLKTEADSQIYFVLFFGTVQLFTFACTVMFEYTLPTSLLVWIYLLKLELKCTSLSKLKKDVTGKGGLKFM